MTGCFRLVAVLACLLGGPASTSAQLLAPGDLQALRSRLPELLSAEWNQDLHSADVVWYTSREMPPAYQHAGGFHSPRYNISADPSDAPLRHGEGGNANVQFPWKHVGGSDRSPDCVTTSGLLLPPRPNGGRWPVVVWQGTLPGHPGIGPESGVRWIYPAGTVLWEVVGHHVAGELVTCEVRARLREIDSWGVGLFRPYPTARDLAAELERLDALRFSSEIAQLRGSQVVQVVDVTDRANRTRPAYVGTAGVLFVPPLPPAVVLQLLRRPFRDALGAEWARSPRGEVCYSPTAAAAGQIVPQHWMGSLVGTDTDSCAACHRTVAQHARTFDLARGWYGHVRGDDGIFTFHPVEPASVAYNGATLAPRLRQSLLQAGVIERYDLARHPASVYRRLKQ